MPSKIAIVTGGSRGLGRNTVLHLAKELGPRGIAVNTVAPGAVATDFSGGMVI